MTSPVKGRRGESESPPSGGACPRASKPSRRCVSSIKPTDSIGTRQAADLLGVTPSAVRRLVDLAQLAATHDPAGAFVLSRIAVLDLVATRTRERGTCRGCAGHITQHPRGRVRLYCTVGCRCRHPEGRHRQWHATPRARKRKAATMRRRYLAKKDSPAFRAKCEQLRRAPRWAEYQARHRQTASYHRAQDRHFAKYYRRRLGPISDQVLAALRARRDFTRQEKGA